jgi:hypothetical protein
MNTENLTQKYGMQFSTLTNHLDALTSDNFKEQFKRTFSEPDARNISNVVYVWSTKHPICRLRDKSNIIYIGKTTQSLFTRHHKYALIESQGGNFDRYKHIITNFGAINIYYLKCDNPKEAETKLLRGYFDEHLELPPLNSMLG